MYYACEGDARPCRPGDSCARTCPVTDDGLNGRIEKLAALIAGSSRIVVFTGAGVSTESGIPDFRSPGGIWDRFDPEEFTIFRFLESPGTRLKQWRLLIESGLIANAEPNRAHLAVAELERLGKLDCVITQNIDNLHQKAGNAPDRVYELHGTMNHARCLGCRQRYAMDDLLPRLRLDEGAPLCPACDGILKPDVIFFGEQLPAEALRQAVERSRRCDLLIVVGSSLVVYPAAYMPVYAREAGAAVAIVNLTATDFDPQADVVIHGKAGEIMPLVLEAVRRNLGMTGGTAA
ncbi:MAG: NAD-dependent deacylase [Deltaproteobacteria bacterium]|nr:NAD-dependent deacylase [Deltaproteobacteria bacterium]